MGCLTSRPFSDNIGLLTGNEGANMGEGSFNQQNSERGIETLREYRPDQGRPALQPTEFREGN